MPSIVRASKFRHVFGTPFKPEQSYTELRANVGAWDPTDFVKVNPKYAAVPWMGGGGSLAILPLERVGKQPADVPCITGHSAQILDFDFHPFNTQLIATGSADCTAKLWQIPEGGLTEHMTEAAVVFEGHSKKVGTVMFHPTANNVLLTVGVDKYLKLWDVETGEARVTVDESLHGDQIHSAAWNRDGSLIATTSKDKKLRVIDPRGNTVVQEAQAHQGTKGSRVCWLTGKGVDKILSVGFSKQSERQYALWDPRDLSKPIKEETIDMASGTIMPFYEEDSNLLFLAGKGDGNVRFFEVVDEMPYLYMVGEFKTSEPQRGMGMLPKYAVDTSACEMVRLYKLGNTGLVPISFTVPRRADSFQSDLFGETRAPEPALDKDAWFGGANAEPKMTQFQAGKSLTSAGSASAFSAKQEKKVAVDLPKKTTNPQELLKQNEELRARVEELTQRIAELEAKQ